MNLTNGPRRVVLGTLPFPPTKVQTATLSCGIVIGNDGGMASGTEQILIVP